MNHALLTALISIGTAQLAKIPVEYVQTKKWNWKSALTPGGFPSSHSAGVTSLATVIGLQRGFRSPLFALSTVFSLVVMYDASGVRRHAGEIASALNDLQDTVDVILENHPNVPFHHNQEHELVERIGHKPKEVLGGALYGIGCGIISHLLTRR